MVTIKANIGSHPKDEANHTLKYTVAPFSAGGMTIAVGAFVAVAEP